jgi:hypothetical protein
VESIHRDRKVCLLEAVLEERRSRCAFLLDSCEAGFLTPEQLQSMRETVDDLNREKRVLAWMLGSSHQEPRGAF